MDAARPQYRGDDPSGPLDRSRAVFPVQTPSLLDGRGDPADQPHIRDILAK